MEKTAERISGGNFNEMNLTVSTQSKLVFLIFKVVHIRIEYNIFVEQAHVAYDETPR